MTDNKQMNDWYRANQERLKRVGKLSDDESFDSIFVPPNTMNHSISISNLPKPKTYALTGELHPIRNNPFYRLKVRSWAWLKDTRIC